MSQTQNLTNQTNIDLDKIPQTLEEQKEYYLNLFQKWEKDRESAKVKEQSPKFWELLQRLFWFKDLKDRDYLVPWEFLKVASLDPDLKAIFLSFEYFNQNNYDGTAIKSLDFVKPALIITTGQKLKIRVCDSTGSFNWKIVDFNKNIILDFDSCDFSSITLENFDRGYFSPETNAYLNQMDAEGKLTLINCTWSGLPVLREDFSTQETGKKIWEKEIVLDEKTKPLKTLLHKHLAFFADFVELTEGKKVQIRITSQTNILLVELFSFNGATKELIDRKYYEYINYSVSEDNDTSKISFSDKIDLISRISNEGAIGFEKGLFVAQKSRIEELKNDKFELQELAKILATKLPDFNTGANKVDINLKIEQNQSNSNFLINSNTIKIENKIKYIFENKANDRELKAALDSLIKIKDEISSSNLALSDKDESLEYILEIIENIETGHEEDLENKTKILKRATRGLISISGQITVGMLTNAAWEVFKTYLFNKFGIIF